MGLRPHGGSTWGPLFADVPMSQQCHHMMCHCSCDTLLQLEAPHQLVGFVSVMHLRVEVSDAATSTLPETPEAGHDLVACH